MTVKDENPPYQIAERCAGTFNLKGLKPVFTFGETIYNPHHGAIDPSLYAHEATHAIQQGQSPQDWWDKYLTDKHFRFSQELAAYRVQYKTMKQLTPSREELAKLLTRIAMDLSGDMYGNLCTFQDAIGLIRE